MSEKIYFGKRDMEIFSGYYQGELDILYWSKPDLDSISVVWSKRILRKVVEKLEKTVKEFPKDKRLLRTFNKFNRILIKRELQDDN